MVIEVAPNGKVSLSRRAALTGIIPEDRPRPQRREFDRGGDRGGRRDDRGGRGPRREERGSFE
jgi:polyribonucleotide nucleotidyltransferase